jgi:O-antigen ligase
VIGDLLAGGGLLAAAACAGASLLVPPSRRRSTLMLAAAGLVPILIAGDQWDSALVAGLRDHPVRLVLLAAAALGVAGGLTLVFRARPVLLPLAIVAALPFRIPLEAGGEQANLLVPLYLVIAAGILATALRSPQGSSAGPLATLWLPRMVAAVVVLYAMQTLYSEDFSQGLQTACFFLIPFSLMFVLLTEVPWDRRLVGAAFALVVAEGIIFVGVGMVEYGVRELLWNQQVIHSNDFRVSAYFRVNSLFWDPNILGRYLALVILLAAAVVLWTRDRRETLLTAAIVITLWLGLLITFSQSSFIALLAGLGVLAALRWSLRVTAMTCGAVAVAAGVVALAFGSSTSLDLSAEQVLNRGTSGRANLVSGGLELAADRPLWGWGAGSFVTAYREQQDTPDGVAASHTEAITVAAEQGALGIAAYLALLVAAFAALLRGIRPIAPGLGRRGPPVSDARAVARIGLVAAFAALVVHTMAYASFLPDPITWVLLAVGARLAVADVSAANEVEPTAAPDPVRAPA